MKSKIHNIAISSIETLLTLGKIASWSKRCILPKKENKKLLILGNGPSLTSQTQHILNQENADLLCVNHFATTDLYEKLQPTHYVITAPELIGIPPTNNLKELQDNLIRNIKSKTSWNINILLPRQISLAPKWIDITESSNINLYRFNSTPIEGLHNTSIKLCEAKLGMPRPHNVLIPSLMVGLWLRYKHVYLYGSDHSWLKEINVTDKNHVLLRQPHFYDNNNDIKELPMRKKGIGERKLHEILEKFLYSFKAYHFIKELYDKNDITILNMTIDSYIDAFNKQSIEK